MRHAAAAFPPACSGPGLLQDRCACCRTPPRPRNRSRPDPRHGCQRLQLLRRHSALRGKVLEQSSLSCRGVISAGVYGIPGDRPRCSDYQIEPKAGPPLTRSRRRTGGIAVALMKQPAPRHFEQRHQKDVSTWSTLAAPIIRQCQIPRAITRLAACHLHPPDRLRMFFASAERGRDCRPVLLDMALELHHTDAVDAGRALALKAILIPMLGVPRLSRLLSALSAQLFLSISFQRGASLLLISPDSSGWAHTIPAGTRRRDFAASSQPCCSAFGPRQRLQWTLPTSSPTLPISQWQQHQGPRESLG